LETVRCPASATQVPSLAASMCLPRHVCPYCSSFSVAENEKGREPLGARPLVSPSRDHC